MSVIAEDRQIMGTKEDAQEALVTKLREWRSLRQPIIADRKTIIENDRRERQLRFEICNAGLHWLWHLENE